jgi:DNA-binding response OmpR family regulator
MSATRARSVPGFGRSECYVAQTHNPPSWLLGLPRLEGEAFAQELQRLVGGAVPILVASGSKEDLAGVAARIQAQDWIRKPFDLDDLERRLRGFLKPELPPAIA